MTDDKVAHCDCGYEASGNDEAELVSEIRRHALTAHGIAFSFEDALLVVLRSQLECGGRRCVATVARSSTHTRRRGMTKTIAVFVVIVTGAILLASGATADSSAAKQRVAITGVGASGSRSLR